MTVEKTRSSATPLPMATLDRRGWLALLTLGFGVSLVIMDATIVNVALPVVMADLHLTGSDAQWLNASYALVFAATLVTVGRAGDLRGRRLLFAIGLVVFMISSIFAGLATGPTMLIVARFVQGLGAAMVVPSTLSTLNAMFVGKARGIGFAVWGSAIGGMAALGPLIGGWLATDVSWRWAFWLNIPVGLAVLVGILTVLPETRDASAVPGRDPLGVILSGLGMAGLVFGLLESSWFGWWRQDSGALSPVPFALVGGLVCLVAFAVVERRRRLSGRPVLVDISLFALPTFRWGVLAALVVAFGEFGLIFTLPLLLQSTLGYSALGTGAVILVLALGTFVVSAVLPQLAGRITPRQTVQIGLAAEAVAVAGLALTLSADSSRFVISGWLFLYGMGVGMATAQLTALLLSDVPREESGQASGLQSAIRQLGSAMGVATLGGLLVSSLASTTRANLLAAGIPAGQAGSITAAVKDSAGMAIAGFQARPDMASVAQAAGDAMIHASRVTTAGAAVILLLGFFATFALPVRPTAPADVASGH